MPLMPESTSESETTTRQSSHRSPAGRPRGRWLGPVVLISVGVLVASAFYLLSSSDPALGPAIAATRAREPDRLSPQLQRYLLTTTEWVDKKGGDPERHRTLGLVYEANHLWQEAYDSFTVALTLEPDHALTQYHRARCLIGMGRLDEAERMLATLAAEHPGLAPAVCRWGELLLDRGLFDEAERAFALVTEYSPKAPHGYVGRGAALVLSGSYLEAVEVLEQAVARDRRYPRSHYLLGLAYRGLGRKAEALASMRLGAASGVEELPDAWRDELARHGKQISDQIRFARSVQKSGNHKRAITLLEEALRWNPDNVRVLKALAVVFQGSRQCETALIHLARARQMDPNYPGSAINIASCLVELDRLDEAETAAREAVAIAPNLSSSHMLLAFILTKLERDAEALEAIDEARRLDPQEPRIAMRQAQLSLRLNRRDDAQRYFEEVTQLSPSNVQAHLALAKVQASQGHWELAEQSIFEATFLFPDNPRVAELARVIARKQKEGSP